MKSKINNCEACSEVLMDYIDGQMEESHALGGPGPPGHLPAVQEEEKELREVMETIDHTPLEQPSTALREGFERMLRTEMALENAAPEAGGPNPEIATENNNGRTGIQTGPDPGKVAVLCREASKPTGRPSIWRPLIQVAAACVLLAVGIAIGSRMRGGGDGASSGPNDQISQLQSEVKDMRPDAHVQPAETGVRQRKDKGVNYAEQIPHPDGQVMQALIATLNHDKNVNVRLASLYSLSRFSDNPVGEGFIGGIAKGANRADHPDRHDQYPVGKPGKPGRPVPYGTS